VIFTKTKVSRRKNIESFQVRHNDALNIMFHDLTTNICQRYRPVIGGILPVTFLKNWT